MRRYLVVANQTLGGEHLTDKVRECLAEGPCQFYVVVPTTHDPQGWTWDEDIARAEAGKRLEAALARFRKLGADVDGEVGDINPVDAIRDVASHREFDEIILSTLPVGRSRWLKMDLPHRVERAFSVPVTHITGNPEPTTPTPA
jgi:hypothetical protein